jgi:hypothetical protein
VSLLQMARVGAPWPVVGELVREGREGEGEGAWLRASGVGGRGGGRMDAGEGSARAALWFDPAVL